jgi:hypothetical protein
MKPFRALFLPLQRHLHRIVPINGEAAKIPLEKPHTLTVMQINGGYNNHFLSFTKKSGILPKEEFRYNTEEFLLILWGDLHGKITGQGGSPEKVGPYLHPLILLP